MCLMLSQPEGHKRGKNKIKIRYSSTLPSTHPPPNYLGSSPRSPMFTSEHLLSASSLSLFFFFRYVGTFLKSFYFNSS